MIVSFRHKGLEELYKKGKTRRISKEFFSKLLSIMDLLSELNSESDVLAFDYLCPHKLIGKNLQDSL